MSRRNRAPKIIIRPITLSGCNAKRRYSTKHEAEQIKIDQENLQPDLELSTYHCPGCQGWHLTKVKESL